MKTSFWSKLKYFYSWWKFACFDVKSEEKSFCIFLWNEGGRYLGTLTYISLKNLIEKLEIKDIRDWEKWWAWDQVKWWESNKKRWTFKDTAYFKANFTTDKNWEFKITTDSLPDNLTTWQIESIVSTPDNKIWIAQTSISTSKQLMISENLQIFIEWWWYRIFTSCV